MHVQASYRYRAELLIAARRGIGDPNLVQSVAERDAVIDKINLQAKRRRYALKIQQKINRALESFVRRYYTDWRPNASEEEREKANKLVKDLITRARSFIAELHALEKAEDWAGAEQLTLKTTLEPELVGVVELTDQSCAPADKIRDSAETKMEQLAKQLPVAQWIETIHGIALPGLALIVAEAAAIDTQAGRVVGLDGYSNPAKLWKRLGYAPYDGHAGSTWKREKWRPRKLTSEEWIGAPFSGERYAAMYVQANWLVNHQWISAKKTGTDEGRPNGPYGEIYAKRRKHCDVTHPDWTDEHRRKDGLRIAFKAFLVDLWKQWIDSAFLGQNVTDAQSPHAEIAAVGQFLVDAHEGSIDGGSNSDNLGHVHDDAHLGDAEIAAVGQCRDDAHATYAGGGTSSHVKRKTNGRGQATCDTQKPVAATAAAGHAARAAQSRTASSGTKSKAKPSGHRKGNKNARAAHS